MCCIPRCAPCALVPANTLAPVITQGPESLHRLLHCTAQPYCTAAITTLITGLHVPRRFALQEMGAAAIFQQPAAGGRQAALPDVLRREHSTRRSSLEFVMASSSRANNRRTSLESALCHTPAAAASIRGAHHHYKGGWRVSTDTRGAPSAASTVLKEPSEGDVGFDDNNRIMAVLRNFAIAAGSTQGGCARADGRVGEESMRVHGDDAVHHVHSKLVELAECRLK